MNLVAAIANWRSKRTAVQELDGLNSDELGALARDVGLSANELTRLAACGDAAGRELPRFMRVLGIEPEKIEARHGDIMRSMSITCSICAKTSRCRRDLDHGQALAVRSYCPNVEIIEALKSATCR